MPNDATIVAAIQADPVGPTLLSYGEVLELAAVLERVVAVRMNVAPWVVFSLRGRRRLGLLGKGFGDEDTLVGS